MRRNWVKHSGHVHSSPIQGSSCTCPGQGSIGHFPFDVSPLPFSHTVVTDGFSVYFSPGTSSAVDAVWVKGFGVNAVGVDWVNFWGKSSAG